MSETWIEEVLFRGRPPSGPGSEESPRFHVVFGVQTINPISETLDRSLVGPVDAAVAESYGYTPLGIVGQINLEAFKRIAELEQKIEELERSDIPGEQ